VNIEAEAHLEEEEGIVQVEHFGMHLNKDGTIIYGLKIESISDSKSPSGYSGPEHVSLDNLSRILVDIHQDSSLILADLMTNYQDSLLSLIFAGDTLNRGKYNLIIAAGATPTVPAVMYMDKGNRENELKQVLGDLTAAYDIGTSSVLVLGRNGAMVVGNPKQLTAAEPQFLCYLSLLVRELFIRNFFNRIVVLGQQLAKLQDLVHVYFNDPANVETIRFGANDLARNIVLMRQILGYLLESLEQVLCMCMTQAKPTRYSVVCSGCHPFFSSG
jgi:WD repeat-containing protein 35